MFELLFEDVHQETIDESFARLVSCGNEQLDLSMAERLDESSAP